VLGKHAFLGKRKQGGERNRPRNLLGEDPTQYKNVVANQIPELLTLRLLILIVVGPFTFCAHFSHNFNLSSLSKLPFEYHSEHIQGELPNFQNHVLRGQIDTVPGTQSSTTSERIAVANGKIDAETKIGSLECA
jgi:hypothetical protein